MVHLNKKFSSLWFCIFILVGAQPGVYPGGISQQGVYPGGVPQQGVYPGGVPQQGFYPGGGPQMNQPRQNY